MNIKLRSTADPSEGNVLEDAHEINFDDGNQIIFKDGSSRRLGDDWEIVNVWGACRE